MKIFTLIIVLLAIFFNVKAQQKDVYEEYKKQQTQSLNDYKKEYYKDISKLDLLYKQFIASEKEIYNCYKNLGYIPAKTREKIAAVEKIYPKKITSIPIDQSLNDIKIAERKWETKKTELSNDSKKAEVFVIPDEVIPEDDEDKLIVEDTPPDVEIVIPAANVTANEEVKMEIDANRPIFYPLPKGSYRVSSKFNLARRHPVLMYVRKHEGVDFAAPRGTKVYAAADGIVQLSKYSRSAGKYIIVNHQNGYTTSYMHLSRRYVSNGDKVKKGQVIGLVGNTGISTGNHLHYEIRENGTAFDPEPFMKSYF